MISLIASTFVSLGAMWLVSRKIGPGKNLLLGWYPTWALMAIFSFEKQILDGLAGLVLALAIWIPYLLTLFVVFSDRTRSTH
jgi:hypothetical protein